MVCDQDQPGAAPLAATATATAAADAPTLAVATAAAVAAAVAAPVAVDRYLEELRAFDRMALVHLHRRYFVLFFSYPLFHRLVVAVSFDFFIIFCPQFIHFFSDSCLS